MVVLVALVVMGPKDLPKMLRRLGQWAGKIRRAAADLRAQSGIDDALRSEGLADDIAEIRKLARGELDAVQRMARVDDEAPRAVAQDPYPGSRGDDFYVVRDREYPRDGADAYGALPDNAIVYAETLPRSTWARDPLYVMGDADAEVPPEPERPADTAEISGGVGPTLIGGVGLTVPYEPPGANDEADDTSTPSAPRDSSAAGPTLIGVAPSELDRKDEATAEDEAEDANASAEARS